MKILHQIFSPHNLLVMLFVVLLQTSLAMHLHNNIKQNTKKPWTICRQQKMIDKNLIFSPAKFIVPIFDLSNKFDFLTYSIQTYTLVVPTWAFSMVIVKLMDRLKQ